MGAWDIMPWDNDSAADWYADLFESTDLAARVEKTLRSDPDESADEIRAAAAIVIMLGRTHIWPVERLDNDLRLAADQLEAVARTPEYAESPEFVQAIQIEVAELRSRLKPGSPPPTRKPWWKFW